MEASQYRRSCTTSGLLEDICAKVDKSSSFTINEMDPLFVIEQNWYNCLTMSLCARDE